VPDFSASGESAFFGLIERLDIYKVCRIAIPDGKELLL
jgi:hypothetical protein